LHWTLQSDCNYLPPEKSVPEHHLPVLSSQCTPELPGRIRHYESANYCSHPSLHTARTIPAPAYLFPEISDHKLQIPHNCYHPDLSWYRLECCHSSLYRLH